MDESLLQLLAGRRGHFRMESGYHSEQWFDLNALLAQADRLKPFVTALARRMSAHRIEAVCGPMTGGAMLAHAIASELGIEYFFTQRIAPPTQTDALFPVRYRLPDAMREQARGKTVAIVDDAISTGSAVRGTFADLIAAGAKPIVVGALIVFGNHVERFAAEHALALEAIARTTFNTWKPEECPLCRARFPIESVSDEASPK